jgi:DNA repair exonuclease SbcCD ATPase subunit
MSISHKYIEFNQNSIYLLNGQNNDVTVDGLPSSNGSGKSSILLAIIHALYNRNPKLSTLDTVNNIVTATPYTLTICFEHNDEVYKVVNDRTNLSITVFNETTGKLLSRKIKESLVCIEEIIGLSYEEFIALTYIDQTTLSNIFNQRTSLITKFLNLSELTEYERIVKNRRAEVNREIKVLDVRISDIKNRLLNVVDIDEVNKNIESLEAKLDDININHTYI